MASIKCEKKAFHTWIGWIIISDDANVIKIDVAHLVVFSFFKLMPLSTVKNTDAATNKNDTKYAIILTHHGNENLVLMLWFL